ncbi:MAG: histidine phosphatase family protein [Pseudomonadota bacterium]
MKRVFIVTHTEASHHKAGLVGGWYDSALTALGHDQAQATALKLASMIDDSDVQLISSDLKRAVQTSKPIAEAFGCDVALSADLREISYGTAEGKPDSWLEARWVPTPDENRMDHRNLPGNETRREFATRIYRGFAPVLEASDGTFIIVTHGFAQTFVIAAWIGMPIEETGLLNFASTPGGITELVQDDHFRNRAVKSLANRDHLTAKQVL